jgi:hypothetical protein
MATTATICHRLRRTADDHRSLQRIRREAEFRVRGRKTSDDRNHPNRQSHRYYHHRKTLIFRMTTCSALRYRVSDQGVNRDVRDVRNRRNRKK